MYKLQEIEVQFTQGIIRLYLVEITSSTFEAELLLPAFKGGWPTLSRQLPPLSGADQSFAWAVGELAKLSVQYQLTINSVDNINNTEFLDRESEEKILASKQVTATVLVNGK